MKKGKSRFQDPGGGYKRVIQVHKGIKKYDRKYNKSKRHIRQEYEEWFNNYGYYEDEDHIDY